MTLVARDPATHVSFSRGETIGQLLDAEAGLASFIAGLFILCLIFHRIHSTRTWESLDVSVIALFVAEVIQGVGHVMNLKWVVQGEADTGSYCTAQGLVRQLGGTGVALATLTIAVQTFLVIWRLKNISRRVSTIVTLVEAFFLILLIAIAPGIHTRTPNKYYEVPTPYWCWIGSGFPRQRIALEYFWFWLALFGSIILYVPLFLLHFRIIPTDPTGERWYMPRADLASLHHQARNGHGDDRSPNSFRKPALPRYGAEALSRVDLRLWSTILYPICYFVSVLPLTIVRFMGFHQQKVTGRVHTRPVATFFVVTIFSLSGVMNAILYRVTRANIFQGGDRSKPNPPPIRAHELGYVVDSPTGSF